MDSEFKQIETPIEHNRKSSFNEKSLHSPSKITSTIGRGEDAKNSLVYLTLKWTFTAGIVISVLIVINHWFFRINDMVPDFMGDIGKAWKIMVPLITLALGYAFGKSQQ